MAANETIQNIDISGLAIIHYPDPRLRVTCSPVEEIDESVRRLVQRMFELMFARQGVGLAAPQVGVTVRLFIACPTLDPNDRRVYVNPRIISESGRQEEEEGCLSIPGVHCRIKRYRQVTVEATHLDGERFQETGQDLTARIFQHEHDHLEGTLIVDRMGTVARLANRKALRELEERAAEA